MSLRVPARSRTFGIATATVAAAIAFAGAPGPLGGPAAAATRAPAPEVVLDAATRTVSPGYPVVAGRTGFAHRKTDGSYRWTDYAGGATSDLRLEDKNPGVVNTMADVIAYAATADTIKLVDAPGGAVRTLQLPPGFKLVTVHGETVVATATTGDAAGQCHLFHLDGPVLDDLTVSGLPSGAVCGAAFVPAYGVGDPSTTVIAYVTGGRRRYGLVDLDDATSTELPITSVPKDLRVTDDSVSWYDLASGSVKVLSRTDLHAAPRSVQIVDAAHISTGVKTFLLGDRVVRMNSGNGALTAIAPDGTTTTLLPFSYADRTLPGPDGSLLTVGKGPSGDYAVHRFTVGPDGAPVGSEVLDVPWESSHSTGLALAGSRLVTYETTPAAHGIGFYGRELAVTGAPTESGRTYLGPESDTYAVQCEDPQGCPAIHPAADGSAVYTTSEADGYRIHVVDRDHPAPGRQVEAGAAAPTLHGVSGQYFAYVTGTGSEARTEVRDLDSLAVARTAPAGPSALWGGTLWQMSATSRLTATDVAKGTVTRTLTTGASCTDLALQASARYVYWECGAVPTAAGVVDLTDGSSRPVAVGATPARLGDTFLVRLDAERHVVVTDLTGAFSGDRVLGTVDSTLMGAGWAADPYSGLVAYAGEDRQVHVVRVGIGSAPLTAIDSSVPDATNADSEGFVWRPTWWLSSPAASWTLSLTNKATGVTAQTLSGGEARGLIDATWDGVPLPGHPVPNGAYTWTLTAKPADGQGAALTVSGSVKVTGGAAVPRDFTGNDGFGDLLAFTSAGAADFRAGTGTGLVDAKVSGPGWTGANSVTASVPFDDVSGDRCNDVLVRVKSGELRAYRPSCGGALKPTTPYAKVGLGWNVYDALTSPGDLTGDGRADVVARETSTGYLYLYESTGAGAFKARVKIGTGWKGYLPAGAGDVNGDGKGDLLARDKAGVLWRYAGTGKGSLAARMKVGGGWQVYDALVGVGDVSGDGRADLLARDTSGVLWSYRGDGKGRFAARAKVGGGWKMYSRLS